MYMWVEWTRCFFPGSLGRGQNRGFGLVYDCLDSGWLVCVACLLTHLIELRNCHGARASLLKDSGCRAADAGPSSLLNLFGRKLTALLSRNVVCT